MPARLASWFAAAPPVERGSAPAVAAKLSRIGQHAPVPKPHRVEERNDIRPERPEAVRLRAPSDAIRPRRQRLVSVGRGDAVFYPCVRLEVVYPGAGGRLRAGQGDDIAVRTETATRSSGATGRGEAGVPGNPAGSGEDSCLVGRANGCATAWAGGTRFRTPISCFPPPGSGEDDASGAGAGFAARAVPRLRAAGWRIEVDGSWPFRLHDGPVAFSTAPGRHGERVVLAPPLAGGGRKGSSTWRRSCCSWSRSFPSTNGAGWRRGSTSSAIWSDRSFQVGWTTAAGSCWMRCGSRRLPRPFWKPRGCWTFTAPMRVGCSRWPRRWREAAHPGPADGRFSISALACARSPRPRRCRRPHRCVEELRPYQRAGYGWLRALSEKWLRRRACRRHGTRQDRADLALLAPPASGEEGDRPSLLVVPTSLVGNWRGRRRASYRT